MADSDVTDATFYSATDQLAKRPSRREATYDARIKGEEIAFDSNTGVPVAAKKQTTTGIKITTRSGKTMGNKKATTRPGELVASNRPGGDEAKRQALQRIVRERAIQMAAQNGRKGRK